jgi:SAM-dependent methyltransferase
MGYLATCAITLALSVANLYNLFLDTHSRLLVLAVGAVPIALFLISFHLYESRTLAGKGDVKQLLLTGAVLLVLAMPTVSLIMRYDLSPTEFPGKYVKLIAQLPIVILGITYLRPIFASTEYYSYFTPLADHLKYIMWDSWSQEPHQLKSTVGWVPKRSELFRNKDSISHFQLTLSCPAIDSAELARLLAPHFPTPTALSIIDIGCGDGAFVKHLLGSLVAAGHSVSEVAGCDPVDWEKEYFANCKVSTSTQPTFDRHGILEAPVLRQYDLVVSSHSLYAALDGTNPTNTENVVKKLLHWRKPSGVVAVIMASRRSPTLLFKAQSFEAMFGTSANPEVAGEDLLATLSAYGSQPVYVDDIMDLTDLFASWDSGNPAPLSGWLDYFLRYPVSENRDVLEYLVGDLRKRVVPFDTLPEGEQARYQSLRLKRTSLVLLHKVMIWIVK